MGEEGLGWWLMMALGVAFVSLGGCVGVAVYLCVSLSLSLPQSFLVCALVILGRFPQAAKAKAAFIRPPQCTYTHPDPYPAICVCSPALGFESLKIILFG